MLNNRSNGKSALYKKLIASVLALGLTASLCACSGGSTPPVDTRTSEQKEAEAIQRNNMKIRNNIKAILGFELSEEFIDGSEMLIDAARSGNQGDICILVKQGKEDALLALLEKNLGMEKNIGPNLIPETYQNQYASELRLMYPIKNWQVSGANIYMARKGSFSYLYLFT